ncbi:pilin [Patescibacteria group bacterium]|nr:pilin [Patescibacteria group bacterium]
MRLLPFFALFLLFAPLLVPGEVAALALNLDYPTVGPFGGIDLDCKDSNAQCGQELSPLLAWLYYFVVGVASLAAFLLIVWAGFQWLASAGNPAKIADARDKIFKAVLGLILVLGSLLVFQLIAPGSLDLGLKELGDDEEWLEEGLLPSTAGIYLYEGAGFTGERILVGNNPGAFVGLTDSDWNDRADSLRIVGDFDALVYEEVEGELGGGRMLCLGSSIGNLDDIRIVEKNGWGGDISAVKISEDDFCGAQERITFESETRFEERPIVFLFNETNYDKRLPSSNIGNTLSSYEQGDISLLSLIEKTRSVLITEPEVAVAFWIRPDEFFLGPNICFADSEPNLETYQLGSAQLINARGIKVIKDEDCPSSGTVLRL